MNRAQRRKKMKRISFDQAVEITKKAHMEKGAAQQARFSKDLAKQAGLLDRLQQEEARRKADGWTTSKGGNQDGNNQ